MLGYSWLKTDLSLAKPSPGVFCFLKSRLYYSSAADHGELCDDNSDLSEEGRKLIENDYETKQDNLPPLNTGVPPTTKLPEARAGWGFSNNEEVAFISYYKS